MPDRMNTNENSNPGCVPAKHAVPYSSSADGLFKSNVLKDGTVDYTRLTTFNARIVTEFDVTDGMNNHKEFEIEVVVQGANEAKKILLKAADFVNLKSWVVPRIGAGAIVYPRHQSEDHVQAAIQALSVPVPIVPVYTRAYALKLTKVAVPAQDFFQKGWVQCSEQAFAGEAPFVRVLFE